VEFLSFCGKGENTVERLSFRPFSAVEGLKTMAYFALVYNVIDDYVARRAEFRAEHLALATKAHERGELVLGGAFADPADKALLVFRANDKSVAESFAKNDPYVRNGLVKSWEVRAWTVVIGSVD
jgi:uncharacterized protein YciI